MLAPPSYAKLVGCRVCCLPWRGGGNTSIFTRHTRYRLSEEYDDWFPMRHRSGAFHHLFSSLHHEPFMALNAFRYSSVFRYPKGAVSPEDGIVDFFGDMVSTLMSCDVVELVY